MLKIQCSNFLLITSLSDDALSKKFQASSKLGFQSATLQLANIHPFLLPLLSQLFNPSACLPSFVLPAWRTAGRLQDQAQKLTFIARQTTGSFYVKVVRGRNINGKAERELMNTRKFSSTQNRLLILPLQND